MNHKFVVALLVIGIIFFTAGFIFGMALGIKQGISWCVDTGLNFLKTKGINLDVDVESIKNGINNYQNQINRCFEDTKFK
jgi:hypothetical protein